MNKAKNGTFRYLYSNLICACLFFVLVFTLTGCKEDTKSSAHKKITAHSRQARALLQASGEKTPFSDTDFNNIKQITSNAGATELTKAQQQRMAEKIVNRLEKQVDFTAFQKNLDRIEQLEKTNPDTPETRQRIYELLFLAGQELQNQYARMDDLSSTKNQQRLTQAEKAINNTINAARGLTSNNAAAARVGAQFLLGTLELKKANNTAGLLGIQDVALMQMQSGLLETMLELRRVNAEKIHLTAKRPVEIIKELENQIVSAQQQLSILQKKVQTVKTTRQKLKQQLDQNTSQARKLNQEYFDLLQKADKQLGTERYKYQIQASFVRSSTGTGKGAIYYETLVDKLTNELAVVNSDLSYQLMRYRNVNNKLVELGKKLDYFKNSPTLTTDIETALAANARTKEKLLKQMQLQIDQVKKMEEKYRELRVAVVGACNAARKAYQSAARDAGMSDRDTKKNAEILSQIAVKELAELWQRDVAHYKSAASLFNDLAGIQEINPLASQIRNEYENQATEAQNAVDKLLPQIKQDKPVG